MRDIPDSNPSSFLGSLCEADAALLAPFLRAVRCRAGQRLQIELGCGLIYFPQTIVAGIGLTPEEAVVGVVGREGMIGWQALLGSNSGDQSAIVLLEGGSALAIPVPIMRAACAASPSLTMMVLHAANRYMNQLCAMNGATGRNCLKQKVSAWLLMLHDRIDGDLLRVTHRALSLQLGIRRASVTDTLHLLESDAALRCDRGVIRVRDRERLMDTAGHLYSDPCIGAMKTCPRQLSASLCTR